MSVATTKARAEERPAKPSEADDETVQRVSQEILEAVFSEAAAETNRRR